ncbi:MAG: CoA-binding protein [Balneolaceae bacterium]|nr:CoA-binding protein [Balneolaceae bacterium]
MEHTITEILQEMKVVAVVGCSANPYRTSHHIAKYLKNKGFRMIPVNPEYDEVLGEKCYDKLADIPREIRIDVVDIFRNPRFTASMVETVIERMNMTGHAPVVWTQLGVSSVEAQEKARAAGLRYIEEKCIMVEHRKVSVPGE